MPERPSARRLAGPPRGVLRGGDPAAPSEHLRVLPSPGLADRVAHFWWVRWALPRATTIETLPHPSVHLVFEGERAEVAGVCTSRFSRRLAGEGWAFGVKFRPAVFRELLGAPVASLTDRVVPLRVVFGAAADALARVVLRAPDLDARIAASERFLARLAGPLPPEIERLRDLVERIASDPSLVRVDDLATRAGTDVRTLQRRFRQHVGASPKWVIQRYRLHEAAERLAARRPPPLASIAADLGYADQAHFARDFRRMVGRSPGQFAAER